MLERARGDASECYPHHAIWARLLAYFLKGASYGPVPPPPEGGRGKLGRRGNVHPKRSLHSSGEEVPRRHTQGVELRMEGDSYGRSVPRRSGRGVLNPTEGANLVGNRHGSLS